MINDSLGIPERNRHGFKGFTTDRSKFHRGNHPKPGNGKFPDNETCQKVMEYAADTGSQKLAGLGLYYLAEYYWQNDQYENTLQCLTESIGYLKMSRCMNCWPEPII